VVVAAELGGDRAAGEPVEAVRCAVPPPEDGLGEADLGGLPEVVRVRVVGACWSAIDRAIGR
jgi:hypothetical protein